jgi:hypothetical protein
LLKGLFGAAFQHIEQAGRPVFVTHGRKVNHDGDVLVTTACMSPNMLIHAQHGHTVKTCRVIKKQAPSFVDNGIISGVPCNIKLARNTRYRQMIQHDGS